MTLKNAIYGLLGIFLFGCTEKPVVQSTYLLGFTKPKENPILVADSTAKFFCPVQQKEVSWQLADVFNPGAIVKDDTVFLYFRAEDNPDAIIGGRTSRIGLAYSLDGILFNKFELPVLYPDSSQYIQWDYPGGCEDPRVVEGPEGIYVMTYTSWDGKIARLSAATSRDLRTWEKHGPVFQSAYEGKFMDEWSKSGSIVCEKKEGKLIATKIQGKYWMYWGEAFVNVAFSENLVDWFPSLDSSGQLLQSMNTRKNKFDSFLTEPGPPALLTDAGILLFYNGKNAEGDLADPTIAKGTYCGGQAIFDRDHPEKFLERLDQPFICPDLPHEVTGQYKAGTTFIEGLVYFKSKWFLYYGTADSMVGVAVLEE